MLAYVLALVVGLGSFALYLSAFFFPEVHRKSDFVWSGLGLFYALVLWVCAGRITGAVLLGQTASVALLLWFGTQTLILRRSLASPADKTAVSENIVSKLKSWLSPQALWQKIKPGKTATQGTETQQETSTTQTIEATETEETATPQETSTTETTDTEETSSASTGQQTSSNQTPSNSSESEDKQ